MVFAQLVAPRTTFGTKLLEEGMNRLLKLHLGCFLILVLGTSASAQNNNLDGHWVGAVTKGNRSGSIVLDLTTSAGITGGTLSDPSGQVTKIENFKLDGNRLTFETLAKEHGQPREMHFVGAVEKNEIRLHSKKGEKSEPTIVLHRQEQ